jgi:hypothetical protein
MKARKRFCIYREMPDGAWSYTTSRDTRPEANRICRQLEALGYPATVKDTERVKEKQHSPTY